MPDNGNNPDVKIAVQKNRVRGSGPILIVAILFVVASFLAWYFTWFGRELSDADISTYLADESHPRHVQHALLQIEQRIERGDLSVRKWYPQIVGLSGNSETEFRLTVAWLMGFDNRSREFHEALLRLVKDQEPIVRRNAALALVRFGDRSGRPELVSVLAPYPVKAVADGVVASTLHEDAQVARGALLARIDQAGRKVVEMRSPLPGTINTILKENGAQVATGDEILSLNSDEGSVWEALRGLSLVGEFEDLSSVEKYASGGKGVSERIKEQAILTASAIRRRATEDDKSVKPSEEREVRPGAQSHAPLPNRQ